MKIVVGNFKAELSYSDMKQWLDEFIKIYPPMGYPDKKVILCPSTAHLQLTKESVKGIPIEIGAQNISHIEKGTYTGEITAPALCGLADYVIIGHSERRKNFQDRFDRIQEKIFLANTYNLAVILCTEETERYRGVLFAVAFEPSSAIGNGNSEAPSESSIEMEKIKTSLHAPYYLYGGSANKSNVHEYMNAGFQGVLVGKKTLDPIHFSELVKNA